MDTSIPSLEKICEETSENAPFNEEETMVLERVCEIVGKERTDPLPAAVKQRYVRGYFFEKAKTGVEGWIEVASRELARTLDWREEVDAATLATRELPKADIFERAWKSGVYGIDKQGHPIWVERTQEINLEELGQHFVVEDLGLLQAQRLERLTGIKMRISEATGRTLYKHCYIFDLGGILNCLCATHLCQVLALGCFVSRTRFEPFSMLQSITILRHSGKCS
mmetsp:Transcript_37251/g.80696  ORF Transcript_37251/g.80696 Transcript_37251/m.80696 type:complete len:224 (-) Transcript_37251:234-905(-)